MESRIATEMPQDRIVVVDVLRAFALFGIIITHCAMGFLAGPPPDPQFNSFSTLDRLVDQLTDMLAVGKFFTIFSFLFGLSFAIQLSQANRKSAPFAGRFAWRLLVLLAIGLVHHMFFSGDILIVYALLGLLLLPIRSLSNKSLVVGALVLMLNIPGLITGLVQVTRPATPEQQQASAVAREQFMQRAQRQFQIKQSGSVEEVIHMNLTESLHNKLTFQVRTGRLWMTFGLFMLGLYAGRMNLFKDSEANRARFLRLLWIAGAAALVSSVIVLVQPPATRGQSLADVLANFAFSVQQIALSAFYLAGVALLFWKTSGQGALGKLAPLGRMGLTTYLMQTVFGLILFYGFGFGLMGQIGVAASVGLGILFFVAQIFIARWWMSHFRLGPIEWLWRSLTYLKLQPNTKGDVSTA